MTCQLLAIDRVGVVALFEQSGNWFRLSMDNGWLPVQLRDELDAHRFLLTGTFEPALVAFADLREIVAHVRNLCLANIRLSKLSCDPSSSYLIRR